MRLSDRLLFRTAELSYRSLSPRWVSLVNRFLPGLKRRFKRAFYDRFSIALEDLGVDGIRLLNYGYADPDGFSLPFELEPEDRAEYPYSWNLVYKTAWPGTVAGKDLLVVGCGRGGDAYFIRRYLKAATVVGVDLSRAGIDACRRAYPVAGLRFEVGDAERLRFPDGAFHAVVNIESSHSYADPGAFYRQVFRVLRPGGLFLYCDYFWDQGFRRRLLQPEWRVVEEEEITGGVLRACRQGQAAREALILRHAPARLHGMLREFCGLPGSAIHRAFEQGICRYLRFAIMKPSEGERDARV